MAVKNDLKKLRKEQRLKQADLAMAVGMCEKSISRRVTTEIISGIY